MEKNIRSNFSFTEIEKKIDSKSLYALIFITIIMSLFFIQALRSYLPGVYVAMFHVVFGHDVFENALILLTIIFFVLPALTNTICKKVEKSRVMVYSIYIIAIARLLIAFHLPNLWQTILSGLIITFYGFFLSILLTTWTEEEDQIESNHKIIIIVFCIFCAFLVDYLIRTIGLTEDISLLPPGLIADFWYVTQYIWLFVQIPLTIVCVHYTRTLFPRFSSKSKQNIDEKESISTIYSLIFIGMGAFWFLQFNIFLYPNIISHYTETNYYFNNVINIVSLIIAVFLILLVKRNILSNVKIVGILNGFMLFSLFLFLFLGTIPILNYIVVILISISIIVIYLNFYLLFAQMLNINFKWEKLKTISNAIAISFAFYVIFLVLHIFTTDWAYIIEAFKGFGPFIILLVSVIFSISTLISITIKSKKEVENNEQKS
ncbi:MAG: hypothetical protein ACTSRI_03515 [Promethearchaeota archaeon]